jgi:hypothetical protein
MIGIFHRATGCAESSETSSSRRPAKSPVKPGISGVGAGFHRAKTKVSQASLNAPFGLFGKIY